MKNAVLFILSFSFAIMAHADDAKSKFQAQEQTAQDIKDNAKALAKGLQSWMVENKAFAAFISQNNLGNVLAQTSFDGSITENTNKHVERGGVAFFNRGADACRAELNIYSEYINNCSLWETLSTRIIIGCNFSGITAPYPKDFDAGLTQYNLIGRTAEFSATCIDSKNVTRTYELQKAAVQEFPIEFRSLDEIQAYLKSSR